MLVGGPYGVLVPPRPTARLFYAAPLLSEMQSEGIAKLALGTKFDDFFAQAVFRKLTYMVECRQFAKKWPARKKREFGPKWSFAIPSRAWHFIRDFLAYVIRLDESVDFS